MINYGIGTGRKIDPVLGRDFLIPEEEVNE
jgi:hypothetical protein